MTENRRLIELETAKMIDVMSAYIDGEKIQTRLKHCEVFSDKEWEDNEYPSWNWYSREYRIRKEPKWFENIPSDGILCKASLHSEENMDGKDLLVVTIKQKIGKHFFDNKGYAYLYAQPIDLDELEDFINKKY